MAFYIKNVGICGIGIIGASWNGHFLAKGIPLTDQNKLNVHAAISIHQQDRPHFNNHNRPTRLRRRKHPGDENFTNPSIGLTSFF